MSNETPQELFERALAAFDLGQKEEAADLLKQVVEEDVENIEAWVTLSKVLDDPDEKRIALSTILQLDPQNAYAKEELKDTEREKSEIVAAEEIVPGITRREARLVGVGLALFTLIVCGAAFAFVIGINNQRSANYAQATAEIVNVTNTASAIETNIAQAIVEQTEEALFATQTAFATITPTLTPTRTPALPDTPTPTITPTEIAFRSFDVPPDTIAGSLIIWGGRNPQSTEYLTLFQYDWQNGEITDERLVGDLVRNPTVDDSGTRLVYMRPVQGGWLLHQINGRAPEQGPIDLGIQQAQLNMREPRDPRMSKGGSFMVFTAISNQTSTEEVFYVNLLSRDTVQLTRDGDNYSSPAVSPDGSLVAVVKQSLSGVDLVLIQPTNQQADGSYPQTEITRDGNGTIQASPAFSPDGIQIAYSAHPASNPDDSDIYIVRLTGTQASPPVPFITSGANERTPVFSPDGRQIAFTSDTVLGVTHVFIFDIETRTTYQVTEGEDPFYLGGWMN